MQIEVKILSVTPEEEDPEFVDVTFGAVVGDIERAMPIIALGEPWQSSASIGAGTWPGDDRSWVIRSFPMRAGLRIPFGVQDSLGTTTVTGIIECVSDEAGKLAVRLVAGV